MYATIQKWGNSNGLRIPKATHDTVLRTLEERLTEFYGKPVQEIAPLQEEEVDWGKAEGREVW